MPNERPTELPEDKWVGPFGGIQSECSSAQIGTDGFADLFNIICRIGQMGARPPLFALGNLPAGHGAILGFMDFPFTNNTLFANIRQTGVLTQDQLWTWTGLLSNPWVQAGGNFSGGNQRYAMQAFANRSFCFTSGNMASIYKWDGNLADTPATIVGSPGAWVLGELATHLVAFNTIESAGTVIAPQRVHWSGADDETDWTSFSSGQTDLMNGLGAITGFVKLFQTGYIFQNYGIMQMLPTGNGGTPFAFEPLATRDRGCPYPYSIASIGDDTCIFVGFDDIYLFDGVNFVSVGALPLQGRQKLGARQAIFAEIAASTNNLQIFGKSFVQMNYTPFRSYWLTIPGGSTWILNLDEFNWTRIPPRQFQDVSGVSDMGVLAFSTAVSGPGVPGGEYIAFGFQDGQVEYLDITQQFLGQWIIKSGAICLGNDSRHSKNIQHVRFVLTTDPLATSTQVFEVNIINEQGQQENHAVSLDPTVYAPGSEVYIVVPFRLPAVFATLTLTGTAIGSINFTEIAIGYNIGQEVRVQSGTVA